MSRYARKLVTSAEDAWDAKINDNFANVFDRPLPLYNEGDDLAALETSFPSGASDEALAVCDYDGTPANGKMFAFNDGTQWNLASNWQMFHRLVPVAKSGAHTVLVTEDYFVLTGASTYDFTLPAVAATNKGRRILVKFNGTGTVTVKPTGGDTFDSAASHVVAGSQNAAYEYVSDGVSDWQIFIYTNESAAQVIPLIVAVGDEVTALTTGTAKVTFRVPAAFTVTGVRASLTTASSSGIVTVDINESGTTILSTKLTIDVSELTSETAAAPPVISDGALADDAEITIDIDIAGTGAAGLKVTILGTM